jgi:hypothetical protein
LPLKALAGGRLDLPGVKQACFSEPDEFVKRKLTPFNQWGGSAKYAKRLHPAEPSRR